MAVVIAWDTVRRLDSCTREVRDEQKAQWEIRNGWVRGRGLSWSAEGTNQNLGDNLRFGKESTAGLSVSLVSQWQRSIHLINVINTLSHASFQFNSFFSRDQERENIDRSSFLSVFY